MLDYGAIIGHSLSQLPMWLRLDLSLMTCLEFPLL
jgi:hypothetical protein